MMSPTRSKYLILVACVSGAMMFAYGRIDYTDHRYKSWDLHDYQSMAEAAPSITQSVRQPFVFRMLGPYLAGLMPFSTETSFRVLSISAGLVLPLLLFLYMSESLVSPAVAALTAGFFVLNKYLYGFPIWNYFQINDLLSQIDIILLMWAMSSRQWPLFGILLFVGSLTKEIPLLLIPVAFMFALQSGSGTRWVPILVAVTPAVCAAVVMRLFLHSDQGSTLLEAFIAYNHKAFSAETWFRLMINSFIPFSFVPIIFFNSTKNYFQTRKHEAVFLLLVILSTFFGYNNERLMAPAFIVFYPLLAVIIQDNIVKSKLSVFVMSCAAILAVLHHTYARYPLPREWTIPLSLFALAAVTVVLILHRTIIVRTHLKSGTEALEVKC